MNRHEAYKLLTETIERHSALPFHELEALVGQSPSERVRTETGEEFLLDVSVEWLDRELGHIRISASADSPGTHRLERLEESVDVKRVSGRGHS